MKNAFLSAVCTAALLTASAASADVTAAEVWDNWKTNLSLYGADGVSFGAETVGDGEVTVEDLALTLDDGESIITSNIGSMVFTENGDGTVSVTMQESYRVTFEDVEEGVEVDIDVNQPNLALVVSGDPDAMNYDVSADMYELRVADIRGEEEISGDMFMRMNNLSGSYQTDVTDGMDTTFSFDAGTIDFLVDVTEGEASDTAVISGQMQTVSTSGVVTLPEGADLDVPETFAGDMTFSTETTAASTAMIFDVSSDGDAANGSVEAGAFTIAADLNPETLSYNVSFADMAVNANADDMPIPFAMSVALFETIFSMPVAASDATAPFGYRLALMDFTINDEIWAMADPAGAIPRDPATLIFDISGMARLFFDIMDPSQQDALDTAEAPGEVESLTINNVQLTAAGAEIKATGDFTFDNTDLETFDGLPRPMGEMNVGITGANTLIDTLVSMGLLPQEQATMGRMMMGMFTQPAGDDSLTSKIEINEQGHVLANGQRIQ